MAVVGINRICHYHSDRAGFAACMSCQKVICQECATTRDGVNFCRVCLAAQNQVQSSGRWRTVLSLMLQTLAGVGLFAATAWVMVWALAIIVGWQ